MGRAPSLHRKSQSGEMESLLSDAHSASNPSSREQSLDQPDYLQVPVLLPPDCNGTTYHVPEHCFEDTPLTTHYQSDLEEDEVTEVCGVENKNLTIKRKCILVSVLMVF